MSQRDIVKQAFEKVIEICSNDDRINEQCWLYGVLHVEDNMGKVLEQMPEQHPDDIAIDKFAAELKAKMARSRDKGRDGWDDPGLCSDEFLARELLAHLTKGNPGTFEDIATFCMMLHHRAADPNVIPESMGDELTTEKMNDGLIRHRLTHDRPSQLADGFRAGAVWAVENCRPCQHDRVIDEIKIDRVIYKCTKCGQVSAQSSNVLEN